MKIEKKLQGSWLQYINVDAPKAANYKLHVALPIGNFDEYNKTLRDLLESVVENGIILGFKILNKGDSHDLEKKMGGKDISIAEDKNARLYNNPVTIYLTETFNPAEIAKLCQQLEACLVNAPPAQEEHLSKADLILTPHVTFRQEALAGEYLPIAKASSETLAQLKKEGEASAEYHRLCNAVAQPEKLIGAREALKEKENNVKRFYNSHYERYNKGLTSIDIHAQFQSACDLLNIDSNELIDNTSKKDWLRIISSHYKDRAFQYHSDKVQSEEAKKVCDELFKLIGDAKTILESISENRAVLNKEALLKQHPYIPEHQYELKEPQFDPYYFIYGLAQNSALVSVIENWKFETKSETYSSASGNGLDQGTVTIYKPYLTMHEKGDKRSEKLMPGYEAFYTLFLAGAIPRRFDQGHFSMIFPSSSKELFSPGLKWLLSKALTTPEFITFMDSSGLIHLSKMATELCLVNIGHNATDIFIYYYIHHPETLYGRRLQKFMDRDGFDKSKAAEFVLNNPQNFLSKVRDSMITEFLELNEPLKNYIFSSPQLMGKLPSYVIDSKLIKPLLGAETDALQDIQSIAVAYLILWEDASILAIFSPEALKKFKVYLEGNSLNFPVYLLNAVQLKLDFFLSEKEVIHDTSKDRVDVAVLSIIEKVFLKNNSIIYSLNKDVLLYLARRLDLQLSDYILIVDALYALGEEDAATPLLTKLGQELNLLEQYPDIRELRIAINGKEERLKKVYAEKRQQRINDLLNVSSEDLSNPVVMNEIRMELNTLGAKEELYVLVTRLEKMFKQEFYNLLRRLREGEHADELKKAFIHLRAKVGEAGCDWGDISKYGDITEGYTLAERPLWKADAKQNILYIFTEMHGCVYKLMCQKDEPYPGYIEKGFYLYRSGNPEKIYALVSHNGYRRETLNLTDLAEGHMQYQEILKSIEWPEDKNTDVKLNDELVKFIISSCQDTIRNCYWIVDLDWDGKQKICEGYFPENMNLSDLEDMLRYTSHKDFVPRMDVILGSIIWQLMDESIGIRRIGSFLRDPIDISPNSYGLTAEMSFLDKLEQLFFIHECLGSADTFYEYLAKLTRENDLFAGLKTFDRALIEQHFRDYAANELAVYIKGSRDSARGKYHRFIDFNDVKAFNELWQLYLNLDEQAAIEAFLPTAYQQLCDAYSANPSILQPIAKYIEIRKFSKKRGPLEDRAAQLELCEIIRGIWENSEHRIRIELDMFGKRKETPWLALMLFALNARGSSNIDLQPTYALLADVLYTPSRMTSFFSSVNPTDRARCGELLGRIYDHPFLRDHFGLNDLTKDELLNQAAQKMLATSLRQKASDQPFPALTMQPVNPSNALTYSGSSSSKAPNVPNALTYSGSEKSSAPGLFHRSLTQVTSSTMSISSSSSSSSSSGSKIQKS